MIASEPTARVEVVQVAVVPDTVCAAHPVIPVPPDFHATVPVGEDPPDSVAVNVTELPEVDGLADEVTVTVGATLFTV